MSDSGDNAKYKWTPESSTLLVSVWTDKQVQKQLGHATKPQLVWESVARYMRKKGYNVTSKQCRSRIKQVLVCYREAKRAGTRAGVEQYYESIDKVLKNRRLDEVNVNGIDTVDSCTNVKSPPKDVKTNKNLQMQYKYQEPIESLLRTEALSPVWAQEQDYPDSPESNETVLAQPYRAFSPVRDAATNTTYQLTPTIKKSLRQNSAPVLESPIQETYRQNSLPNNHYNDVLLQNAVQNVQNQIIQENMQQNQALLQHNLLQAQNHLLQQNHLQNNPVYHQNLARSTNHNMQQQIPQNGQLRQSDETIQGNTANGQHPGAFDILRMQNKLQQSSAANNKAMPQEPRKATFRQNLAAHYKQYQESVPVRQYNPALNQIGPLSPNCSSDAAPNLNDAFCLSPKSDNSRNLNETFNPAMPMYNPLLLPSLDVTTLTNNATYNDDTLSIEFLQDSPSPSDNEIGKTKDNSVNTDNIPNAPFRKKKAQKLEQLMMSAINSQSDVVNKILAAQNDMVSRFLDLDRDRQNRLENRLDHLLTVVHSTVLNKSDKESEIPPPPPEPLITNLFPPPRPGVIPPKLDLVPPKPCRVPCTVSNPKVELVNQNTVLTRPGVVSPITSPNKKPGPIWSKLGPVSQSPFVRAQMQLGLQPTNNNFETRTQSSAERRIAQQVMDNMDLRTLISETNTLLETERRLEEKIENARIQMKIGQDLTARKRLFTQREPTVAMILTAAFLDSERQMIEMDEGARINWNKLRNAHMRNEFLKSQQGYDPSKPNRPNAGRMVDEGLLTGQGESYDRLRKLDIREKYVNDPIDSSTPAKPSSRCNDIDDQQSKEPRQTIQQLAQLVMNSARWRQVAGQNQPNFAQNPISNNGKERNICSDDENVTYVVLKGNPNDPAQFQNRGQQNDYAKPSTSQDRYSYGGQPTLNSLTRYNGTNNVRLSYHDPVVMAAHEMGFTANRLNSDGPPEKDPPDFGQKMGFVANKGLPNYRQQNVRFINDEKGPFGQLQRTYAQRNYLQRAQNEEPPYMTSNGNMITAQNRNLIQQYVRDIKPQRQGKSDKETDSDNDEEFLDTTMSMPPSSSSRRGSLTSTGTSGTATSTKTGKLDGVNCLIS